MKLAISSLGENLESQIDSRFGRCKFIIIFDTATNEFQTERNPCINAQNSAGIQTAQLVSDKNAEVVITGNLGPNAIKALRSAGIRTYSCANCSVKQAIENFKSGNLTELQDSTANLHSGK